MSERTSVNIVEFAQYTTHSSYRQTAENFNALANSDLHEIGIPPGDTARTYGGSGRAAIRQTEERIRQEGREQNEKHYVVSATEKIDALWRTTNAIGAVTVRWDPDVNGEVKYWQNTYWRPLPRACYAIQAFTARFYDPDEELMLKALQQITARLADECAFGKYAFTLLDPDQATGIGRKLEQRQLLRQVGPIGRYTIGRVQESLWPIEKPSVLFANTLSDATLDVLAQKR